MHGSIVIPAILALVLSFVFLPRPASATQLACQANATSPGGGSLTRFFTALAADGTGPYAFHWSFGDGAKSSQQDPEHTYPQIGVYTAVLTVTDVGSQETCSDTVRVLAGLVGETQACGASVDVRWGQVPLLVTFNAFPSSFCGPGPYTWTWRFSDGQFGSQQMVQHEYSEPGTFWVVATQHTASGSCDCVPTGRISAIKSDNVGVGPTAPDGGLRLEGARPNPFGLMTTIAFDLPRPGHARLTILDVRGRTVAELVNDFRPAGPAFSIWQGRASTGGIAPPGLYFVRLEHEGVVRSTRLVRIR